LNTWAALRMTAERLANLIQKRQRASWTMPLSPPGEFLSYNGDPYWWR
jgi:hypothetical protein